MAKRAGYQVVGLPNYVVWVSMNAFAQCNNLTRPSTLIPTRSLAMLPKVATNITRSWNTYSRGSYASAATEPQPKKQSRRHSYILIRRRQEACLGHFVYSGEIVRQGTQASRNKYALYISCRTQVVLHVKEGVMRNAPPVQQRVTISLLSHQHFRRAPYLGSYVQP